MSRFNLKNQELFETAKKEAGIFYHSLIEVYCPYFKEKIAFNAKGWEHLQFKNRNRIRSSNEQYVRFKLLPLVPNIISHSRTLQGICPTKAFELINRNSRWDTILINVTFWEFMAISDNVRMRIVIKQVEGGAKHFFSVIPFWRLKPGTNERMLYGYSPLSD